MKPARRKACRRRARGPSSSPARPPSRSTRSRWAEAGEEARGLGCRAPEEDVCRRRPLALPAQLDRFRSEVRLVARAKALRDSRCPSTNACSPSGAWAGDSEYGRPGRARGSEGAVAVMLVDRWRLLLARRERLHAPRAAHVHGDPGGRDDRLSRSSWSRRRTRMRDMNQEFQAQTQARTALERVPPRGALRLARPIPSALRAAVTLTYVPAGVCPPSGGIQVDAGAPSRTGRAGTASTALPAPRAARRRA